MKPVHGMKLTILIAVLLAAPTRLSADTGPVPAAAWSVREIASPAPANSRQHRMTNTADGKLLLSWVEGADKTASSWRFATWEGGGWSAPRTVKEFTEKLADAPQLLGLKDGALAAAWMISRETPDNPYAADLYLARSTDGGAAWSAPIKPYGPEARIYDAQISLSPLPAGRLALVWTDKRNVSISKSADGKEQEQGTFQLMSTVIDSQGRATPEKRLDGDVCSCCSVGSAAGEKDVLTVYRDHLPGEVRDIARVHWSAKNVKPSAILHDEHFVIEGCPSNGPAVDRRGAQAVVAWFSTAGGKGHVQLAFSKDHGAHFGAPVTLEPETAIGYVDVLLLKDNSALVSWRARAPSGSDQVLKVAQISPRGKMIQQTTAHTGSFANWPSNYPKLKRAGDQVFLAWTDPVKKQVRVSAFDLSVKPQALSQR